MEQIQLDHHYSYSRRLFFKEVMSSKLVLFSSTCTAEASSKISQIEIEIGEIKKG